MSSANETIFLAAWAGSRIPRVRSTISWSESESVMPSERRIRCENSSPASRGESGVSLREDKRAGDNLARKRTLEDPLRDVRFGNDPDRFELCVPDCARVRDHAAPPRLAKAIRDDPRPARPQPLALGPRVGVVRLGQAARAAGLGRREEAGGVAEVGDGEGEEGRGVVGV